MDQAIIEELKSQIACFEEIVSDLKAEKKDLQDQIDLKEAQIETLSEEDIPMLNQQIESLESQLGDHAYETEELKAQIAILEAKIAMRDKEIADLKHKLKIEEITNKVMDRLS